jgi:hypothetical protein
LTWEKNRIHSFTHSSDPVVEDDFRPMNEDRTGENRGKLELTDISHTHTLGRNDE